MSDLQKIIKLAAVKPQTDMEAWEEIVRENNRGIWLSAILIAAIFAGIIVAGVMH